MTSTQQSSQTSNLELALPPEYASIQDILGMPNDRLQKKPLINVIGLVNDYQPPVQTRGTDWKCTLSIVDLNTQHDLGIKVIIFWPREQMPHIKGVADVIIIRKAKVQMWSGYISLLANYSSEFHVFPAASIPSWPLVSSKVISRATPAKAKPPTPAEIIYAVWLSNFLDKESLPSAEEFKHNSVQAMNVKEKFSLLRDVKAEQFYDLIGHVIRIFDSDGRVTMYLSDYTANPLFYNNAWGGGTETKPYGRDGDEYGYVKSRPQTPKDWPGPFGKMAIQLTIYDAHASFVREKVKLGDFLLLKNVQVKMGNLGGCLEGFLRYDHKAFTDKVQVEILSLPEDPESVDPRWKEAVRRKKEYWAKFNQQKQELMDDAKNIGSKRHREEVDPKTNGKKRRKKRRAAAEQKAAAKEENIARNSALNENVRCNHPGVSPTPLSEILNQKGVPIKASHGVEHSLPFVNANYRSNVRVINFAPNNLADFCVGRRVSEYDILSDHSGGESTDNEEDLRLFRQGKGFGGAKVWEWRFALLVEDSIKSDSHQNERTWLLVSNENAQMLLDMDATNLRQDDATLSTLREQLFTLWGDLEEKKWSFMRTPYYKNLDAVINGKHQAPEIESEPETDRIELRRAIAKPRDEPPPDSDEEQPRTKEAAGSAPTTTTMVQKHNSNDGPDFENMTTQEAAKLLSKAISQLPVNNKGFTCCIKQYGIKVEAPSPRHANAGDGQMWKKMFALHGTTIS